MKKLVIALGILSACANSDAMQDYFKGTSRSTASEGIRNVYGDLADAHEQTTLKALSCARVIVRGGSTLIEFLDNFVLFNMRMVQRQYLRSLTITSNVTEIDDRAFRGCDCLNELLFEKGSQLRRIGKFAFSSTAIEDVTIPSSVRIIDDYCFDSAKSLKRLQFEAGSQLKSIGAYAFCETDIVEVIIPSSVLTLGDYCFYAGELAGLEFEEGSMLRRIGEFAFSGDRLEGRLDLPDSLEELGCQCFDQYGSLDFEVFIGKNSQLSKVGARVFPNYAEISDENRHLLGRPDFDPNPKTIMGSNLYWKENEWIFGDNYYDSYNDLIIPNTIQEIDDYCCFEVWFRDILFEEGSQVKKFGEGAFIYSHIGENVEDCEFVIPDSVEEIGSRCFLGLNIGAGRTGWIIFGSQSNLKIVGEDAFKHCNNYAGIIVYSQRVYDLLYQNLAETYGEVEEVEEVEEKMEGEGPNKKKRLSPEAPRLILESEEESPSEE